MSLLPDVLIVLGAVLVPAGVAMVHGPAAVALVGLECVGLGVLLTLARPGGSR